MGVRQLAQWERAAKNEWNNAELTRVKQARVVCPASAAAPLSLTTPDSTDFGDLLDANNNVAKQNAPWFHVSVDCPAGADRVMILQGAATVSTDKTPAGGGNLEVLRIPRGTVVRIVSTGAQIANVDVQFAVPKMTEFDGTGAV